VILKHRRAVLDALGDDPGAQADLGILIGKLVGDVVSVVFSAGRDILGTVLSLTREVFSEKKLLRFSN
jgi:sorbitol-specific phosphotransferase system component IIBC